MSPQTEKVKQFFQKFKFPKFKKALHRYIGFLNYYRNYIPSLSEKLSHFFKLLKETSQFCIPITVLDTFNELNQQLEQSCSLALKQPIKNKQHILMTDASFTAAGHAIMFEDDPNQNLQSRRKTYAPIAFGSKTFNPTQSNCQHTQMSSWHFTLRFPNSDISCGEETFQLSFSQITAQ